MRLNFDARASRGPINSQEGSNLPVHSWFNFGRHHFLWNVYIKTKGRLLKIFNSIKYLTLVYIMAKNINYHIYKPQIIFPPLLSVYNYFFEFSHCLLPVSFSTISSNAYLAKPISQLLLVGFKPNLVHSFLIPFPTIVFGIN